MRISNRRSVYKRGFQDWNLNSFQSPKRSQRVGYMDSKVTSQDAAARPKEEWLTELEEHIRNANRGTIPDDIAEKVKTLAQAVGRIHLIQPNKEITIPLSELENGIGIGRALFGDPNGSTLSNPTLLDRNIQLASQQTIALPSDCTWISKLRLRLSIVTNEDTRYLAFQDVKEFSSLPQMQNRYSVLRAYTNPRQEAVPEILSQQDGQPSKSLYAVPNAYDLMLHNRGNPSYDLSIRINAFNPANGLTFTMIDNK